MLRSLIASASFGETILEWIEVAALAIEILAVFIILAFRQSELSWQRPGIRFEP
jgi:hypothetical protein